MSRQDDDQFERELRDTLKQRTESLIFSRSLEDRVFERIEKGRKESSVRQGWRNPGRRARQGARIWTGVVSGAAAVLVVAAVAVRILTPAPVPAGMKYGLMQAQHGNVAGAEQSASGGPGASGGLGSGAASVAGITATLAPVNSEKLSLLPGLPNASQVAAVEGFRKSRPGIATHGPALAAKSGQAIADGPANAAPFAGSGSTTYGKAAEGSNPGQNGIQELSPKPFTVATVIANTTNKPVNGNNLEGMLFILGDTSGLTPNHYNDWEYFVDGPSEIIPPHGRVLWYFAPNPAPRFQALGNRTAHLVWFFRTPQPGYPTLQLGALPIAVKHVDIRVTGKSKGPISMQFLTITAQIQNRGQTPWAMSSALGMLFFQNGSGSILSKATFKYFDDVYPAPGSPALLLPGQTGAAVFRITGVPGTDMTRLPLKILLISRAQVGV